MVPMRVYLKLIRLLYMRIPPTDTPIDLSMPYFCGAFFCQAMSSIPCMKLINRAAANR